MTTTRLLAAATGAITLLLALPAAACPSVGEIKAFVEAWEAKRPTPALGQVENTAEAYCGQKLLVEQLGSTLGKVVGYKAGLTAKPVQERFGATEPARGVLLEGMLLKDGATVPAGFGARPVWEADMVLVVKDAAINTAKTPEEALKHISGMVPFIELPDLAVGSNVKLDGRQLTAINVAARYGVLGAEVPLPPTPETLKALETMKVVARDDAGATVAESTGAAVLGHPMNVVLWLVENLNAEGIKLKAGDLLSLGSFSPLTPPKSGQSFTVSYEGLPGAATPKVRVTFQ
ncbi:2-keto-4-pentenoate hydratase [Azospirillum sp.]|uniref:2-keto-4-pentenoate hydratase n=1 Tax=Azospirillum sp. TaxID=34012 RepID=UPI002D4BE3D8|nr:fumarylacetoacetate hydrolase family protein [Azospirillum sp.]HYD67700.1 fumarylacetoacetate hydrolase family protein [Azospirillum sp.]